MPQRDKAPKTATTSVDGEKITDRTDARYYTEGFGVPKPASEALDSLKNGKMVNLGSGTYEFKTEKKSKISRAESKRLARRRFDARKDAERAFAARRAEATGSQQPTQPRTDRQDSNS